MSNKQTRQYFAAANTYNGFASFFDKIFNSEEFARVYVLKGGPGTGKSSFMKKIAKNCIKQNFAIEEIYCSSDPNSLDGVIIQRSERKIAILDGTAPHERDAIIPGAIDEIINLGNNWDNRWLEANREKILSKNKQKSEAYKTAYKYLKIAGVSHYQIKNLHRAKFNIFEAKSKAELILDISSRKGSAYKGSRIISSFGKLGNYSLPLSLDSDYKIISVAGNEYSSALFLDACISILETKNINLIVYPFALDNQSLDAIELPDEKILIIRKNNGIVDADSYLSLTPIDLERCCSAERIKQESLEEAKRWFLIASNIHFELEEIYSKAMNFEKNEILLNEKLTEIKNILEKSL